MIENEVFKQRLQFLIREKTDGRGGSLNFWYVLIGIVIAEVVGWTTDVDCGVSPVVCWSIWFKKLIF